MSEELERYEILAEIGQGGFATVYRARDMKLNRLVALKELRPILLQDTAWVKRFLREARTVARLDHPRIVAIHDVAETAGRLFIVMRLVNGPSLEQLIVRQGRRSWPEAVEMVKAVAEGLDYAHTQGILHRDLKPANILLDPERGPMLSDFGLAKPLGDSSMRLTTSGSILGTPHYIAPEIWDGQETTPQSDIYALGCILYEMLIGDKIFGGERPPSVMKAHFTRPLALPKAWPETVPAGVVDILTTALAIRPTERYASAGRMIEVLAALAREKTVEPHYTSPAPATEKQRLAAADPVPENRSQGKEKLSMSSIRILIADDHRLFRQGLGQICEVKGGFDVVGEAENGQEAVELARQLKPDVILMDIRMPIMDGVQATSFLSEEDPTRPVIILTMQREDQYLFDAIKAGARGYLLKDVDAQTLLDAIRRVHRGEALIDPVLAAKVLNEFRRLSDPKASEQEKMEHLTEGEMEVLRQVAQGLDNREIAGQLNLSESTIANRLRDIYQKLHVNNRTQAALYALRRGWASLEEE